MDFDPVSNDNQILYPPDDGKGYYDATTYSGRAPLGKEPNGTTEAEEEHWIASCCGRARSRRSI